MNQCLETAAGFFPVPEIPNWRCNGAISPMIRNWETLVKVSGAELPEAVRWMAIHLHIYKRPGLPPALEEVMAKGGTWAPSPEEMRNTAAAFAADRRLASLVLHQSFPNAAQNLRMTDLPKILAEIHNAQDALNRAEELLKPMILCNLGTKNPDATPAAETLNPAASGGEGWPRYWVFENHIVYRALLPGGVQSSTMALMAAAGEITPMPVAAIFADTQAEPKSVYTWLDWLEKQLPFPVHRVTRGSLTDESLKLRNNVGKGSGLWAKSLIPAFILNKDGSKGIMGRQCTYSYKVEQLEKASRRIAQVKRGQKTVAAIQWIGISLDEIYRMKPARVPWLKHRWPLVDMGMKRHDCLKWMDRNRFPKPPRSACVYCPFHSDAEWKRLKDVEPEEFARAVQYERDLQAVKSQTDNQSGKPFLHASLKPLSEVDFSTEEERGQLNMFNNECEGMCGV